MASSKGKGFEQQFKIDWKKLPNAFIYRLVDQQSGYYLTSANICDFICYVYPYLFLFEIKSHKGNTFPFQAFRQYRKLKDYNNIFGVNIGVILWFIDYDTVCYIPLDTFIKLERDNKRSFHIKYLDSDEYVGIRLPSKKKRTFLTTDYSDIILFTKGKLK